eukprot:jgi/Picre1/27076/NNA_000046.t1
MQHYLHGGLQHCPHELYIPTLQYADDNTVPLSSYADVSRFINIMHRFGRGTGQVLNMTKTLLLPIGQPAEHPRTIAGLQVVSEATILGFQVQAHTGAFAIDWDTRVAKLKTAIRKVKARHLSPFSKFRIVSTYLLPKDLYYAEVVKPTPAQVKEVWTAIRQLLQSNFWRSTAFAANPKEGGLGCLPLQAHLYARDLKWYILLFTAGAEKSWVQLAWNLFLKMQDGQHTGIPACLPIHLLQRGIPGVPNFELQPTVNQHEPAYLRYEPPTLLFTSSIYAYHLADLERATLQNQETGTYVMNGLQGELGWQIHPKCTMTLDTYTVKQGTSLFTRVDKQHRRRRLRSWLEIIASVPRPLHRIFKPLQQLQLPSIYKLPFWEILMDTQVNAQKTQKEKACVCGHSNATPGRNHYYTTECSIACSLYQHLSTGLGIPVTQVLHSIWTNQPPSPLPYPSDTWGLIVVACSYSLDDIRRQIFKASADATSAPFIAPLISTFNEVLDAYKDSLSPGSAAQTCLPIIRWRDAEHRWELAR